jgi:hypothetical protein
VAVVVVVVVVGTSAALVAAREGPDRVCLGGQKEKKRGTVSASVGRKKRGSEGGRGQELPDLLAASLGSGPRLARRLWKRAEKRGGGDLGRPASYREEGRLLVTGTERKEGRGRGSRRPRKKKEMERGSSLTAKKGREEGRVLVGRKKGRREGRVAGWPGRKKRGGRSFVCWLLFRKEERDEFLLATKNTKKGGEPLVASYHGGRNASSYFTKHGFSRFVVSLSRGDRNASFWSTTKIHRKEGSYLSTVTTRRLQQ